MSNLPNAPSPKQPLDDDGQVIGQTASAGLGAVLAASIAGASLTPAIGVGAIASVVYLIANRAIHARERHEAIED